MRDPYGPVDGGAADGAVTLGQQLARRSPQPIFLVGSIEAVGGAQKLIEKPGCAVGGTNLPDDGAFAVSSPINRAVSLSHGRPGAAANMAWDRSRRDLARVDPADSLQYAEHRSFGDLIAIEAALGDRLFWKRKLMRRPDRPRIQFGSGLENRHAPRAFAQQNRPIERRWAAVTGDSGMDHQTDLAAPYCLGNCDLQHRRNDEIGHVLGDGSDDVVRAADNCDAYAVAAVNQLDRQALTQAVVD